MIGYKKSLGKAMMGYKMPLGQNRMGSKMPLLERMKVGQVVGEVMKKASSGLERNVLKR